MGVVKNVVRAAFQPIRKYNENQAKLRKSQRLQRRRELMDVEKNALPRIFGKSSEHGMANDECDPMVADGARGVYAAMSKYEAMEQAIFQHQQEFERTLQAANDFEREDKMKQYARDQLLQATSNIDLLMRANYLIEEDWLADCTAMPGNIYRIFAFGDFFPHEDSWFSVNSMLAVPRAIGCFAIFIVQLFGPPLMVGSATFGVGRLEDKFYDWNNWKYWNPDTDVDPLYDWEHVCTTKALGLVLMFAFLLNTLFVNLNEKNSWKQIYLMFEVLNKETPNFKMNGGKILYLGAFVNNWLCLWLSIAAFLVIGASRNPKDLLMDSLGLLFLFNLDDLDGDLGFATEDDWPACRLAWIYNEIVAEKQDTGKIELRFPGYLTLGMYNTNIFVVAVFAVALPVIAAITPFGMIAPQD